MCRPSVFHYRRTSGMRSRLYGFTLMEVMVVVAVVAILSAIALPSYNAYVIKTRRSAATVCLQERAQLMERYYTTKLTYVDAPAPAACDGIVNSYTVAFESTPTAKAFVLTATPSTSQKDPKCGTLSLNQKGERGESGTAASAAECW